MRRGGGGGGSRHRSATASVTATAAVASSNPPPGSYAAAMGSINMTLMPPLLEMGAGNMGAISSAVGMGMGPVVETMSSSSSSHPGTPIGGSTGLELVALSTTQAVVPSQLISLSSSSVAAMSSASALMTMAPPTPVQQPAVTAVTTLEGDNAMRQTVATTLHVMLPYESQDSPPDGADNTPAEDQQCALPSESGQWSSLYGKNHGSRRKFDNDWSDVGIESTPLGTRGFQKETLEIKKTVTIGMTKKNHHALIWSLVVNYGQWRKWATEKNTPGANCPKNHLHIIPDDIISFAYPAHYVGGYFGSTSLYCYYCILPLQIKLGAEYAGEVVFFSLRGIIPEFGCTR